MGSSDKVYFMLVHTLIIQYFMRRKLRENKKSETHFGKISNTSP